MAEPTWCGNVWENAAILLFRANVACSIRETCSHMEWTGLIERFPKGCLKTSHKVITPTIVNIGEWLWNSAIFKGADKEANINSAQFFVLCLFNMLDWPESNVFIESLSNICRNVFVWCRVTVEKSAQKDRTIQVIWWRNLEDWEEKF